MQVGYKDKKLLYHMTDIRNLDSILNNGLKPRADVEQFVDIADPDIVAARGKFELDQCVPFHFYAPTPFAGRVQLAHPETSFVFITVRRAVAESNGWLIVPNHPLDNSKPETTSYTAGFERIDWSRMQQRDYKDPASKKACMAECLAPGVVPNRKFSSFFVKDEADREIVQKLLTASSLTRHINICRGMFVGGGDEP